MSDNWQILGNAVVLQAVADWRNSYKYIMKHHRSTSTRIQNRVILARAKKDECERFFRSEWFKVLTDLDGEALLTNLKKEVLSNPKKFMQKRDDNILLV